MSICRELVSKAKADKPAFPRARPQLAKVPVLRGISQGPEVQDPGRWRSCVERMSPRFLGLELNHLRPATHGEIRELAGLGRQSAEMPGECAVGAEMPFEALGEGADPEVEQHPTPRATAKK